jgi:uncharacterized membrane protein YuzA (DUF378 family)
MNRDILKALTVLRRVQKMKMNAVDKVAYLLLVVGGLNWGLVGVFEWNLVTKLFGVDSGLTRVVYALVGVAAVYGLYTIVSMLAKGEDA